MTPLIISDATQSTRLQGITGQRLKKGNAGSTPYLVRPWHKHMLEDAAAKVSAQRIDRNGVVQGDETRHTLGGSTDVQWEDGKIDDAQVVRSVHLQMGLAVRVQTCGRIHSLTNLQLWIDDPTLVAREHRAGPRCICVRDIK